jgi:hypothetical protein
LSYMGKSCKVLELVGWEDLDMEEVKRMETAGKDTPDETSVEEKPPQLPPRRAVGEQS